MLNIDNHNSILLNYKLPAQLDHINDLTKAIADALAFYKKLIFPITLCIDELITNTILYGFKDEETRKQGEIEISIYLKDDYLEIVILDNALAFNPFLSTPEPDIDASVDNRAIGGLGVYLVKSLMDKFDYSRNGFGNQVHVLKKIN